MTAGGQNEIQSQSQKAMLHSVSSATAHGKGLEQGVFAPLRMFPLTRLREISMPGDPGVWLMGVSEGRIKWQIPELGLFVVNPSEWCLLGDRGAKSVPYLDPHSSGFAVWLPLSAMAVEGMGELPSKLHCLLCPVRNVSLFIKGTCRGRMGWVMSALMAVPAERASAAWMRQSYLAEWIALVFESDEVRLDRGCASCWHEKDVCAIRRVAAYLNEHPEESHSISGLARAFHVNECKLKKGFREHYGCTVFGYLRRIRMDHAMRMLRQNERSVMEVSVAVGYANPSHFARAFREVHGLNPGEVLRPG